MLCKVQDPKADLCLFWRSHLWDSPTTSDSRGKPDQPDLFLRNRQVGTGEVPRAISRTPWAQLRFATHFQSLRPTAGPERKTGCNLRIRCKDAPAQAAYLVGQRRYGERLCSCSGHRTSLLSGHACEGARCIQRREWCWG